MPSPVSNRALTLDLEAAALQFVARGWVPQLLDPVLRWRSTRPDPMAVWLNRTRIAHARGPGLVSLSITADDRFGILDLYSRYTWTLDTVDAEGHAANFVPDGLIGMGLKRYRGHDEIVEYAKALFARELWPGSQHYIGQLMFLEGDSTRCKLKAYSTIIYRMRDTTIHFRYLGIYRDTCVKVGDLWLFEERLWELWEPDKIAEYRS